MAGLFRGAERRQRTGPIGPFVSGMVAGWLMSGTDDTRDITIRAFLANVASIVWSLQSDDPALPRVENATDIAKFNIGVIVGYAMGRQLTPVAQSQPSAPALR